jgi:hypothetical protein
LADAVLCADGPVRALAALSLEPEHRREHGAAYDLSWAILVRKSAGAVEGVEGLA